MRVHEIEPSVERSPSNAAGVEFLLQAFPDELVYQWPSMNGRQIEELASALLFEAFERHIHRCTRAELLAAITAFAIEAS